MGLNRRFGRSQVAAKGLERGERGRRPPVSEVRSQAELKKRAEPTREAALLLESAGNVIAIAGEAAVGGMEQAVEAREAEDRVERPSPPDVTRDM